MQLASQIVGVKLSTAKYIIKGYKNNKERFVRKLKPILVNIEKQNKITKEEKDIQFP